MNQPNELSRDVAAEGGLREFEEWLNDRRGLPVGEVFHDVVAKFRAACEGAGSVLPTNEDFENLWDTSHQGHPADFAADVLERWGGWKAGTLGHGGSNQLLGLLAIQAEDIRKVLDELAPETVGNLQTRIRAALSVPSEGAAVPMLSITAVGGPLKCSTCGIDLPFGPLEGKK